MSDWTFHSEFIFSLFFTFVTVVIVVIYFRIQIDKIKIKNKNFEAYTREEFRNLSQDQRNRDVELGPNAVVDRPPEYFSIFPG